MKTTEQRFSYSGGSTTLHTLPATNLNAPQIIALHGFTGLGSDFALCAHTAHGAFSWICPDLPGHGHHETSLPYFKAIYKLLDALLEKFPNSYLLGYSMGARLALNYALDTPYKSIAGLQLISATAGIEDTSERKLRLNNDENLAKHIIEIGLDAFLGEWMQHPIIVSQQKIPSPWKEEMARERRKKHSVKGISEAIVQFSPGLIPARWTDLHQLKIPCTFYYGEQDGKYKKLGQRFANALKQTQLVDIPQSGHAPHLEKHVIFVKKMRFQKNIKNK